MLILFVSGLLLIFLGIIFKMYTSISKEIKENSKINRQLINMIEVDRIIDSFPCHIVSSLYQQFLIKVLQTNRQVPKLDSTFVSVTFILPIEPFVDNYLVTEFLRSFSIIDSIEVVGHKVEFDKKESCYMNRFSCEIYLNKKDERIQIMLNNSK